MLRVFFHIFKKPLCVCVLGVWTYTGLTVWFNYDYHVIDSVQFDITMHHDAVKMHCILNFQFYFTCIQFCQ